ncbi:cysteine-rich CWC family protein [Burkholderia guangdongensis]|uniref:cysteine-rich CWC family protein n=1 Tax=Burkholderia guangdongensis TaxID=1792500 RepID=UPI0015CEE274|nr:cysteine-rich CWC family protein [Burkholderia guangdongensis]
MTEPATSRRSEPHRARCPQCGRAFDCGAGSEPFTCWCAAMPSLPGGAQPADGARCLCPGCLADALAQRDPARPGGGSSGGGSSSGGSSGGGGGA